MISIFKKGLVTYSLVLFFTLFSTAFPLVIITHGFGGNGYGWYLPGGDFHDAIKNQAIKMGHEVMGFSWDQSFLNGFSSIEQDLAGLQLACLILNHKRNPKGTPNDDVIVVAHSYGGLVSYRASQVLYVLQTNPDFLTSQEHAKSLLRQTHWTYPSLAKIKGYNYEQKLREVIEAHQRNGTCPLQEDPNATWWQRMYNDYQQMASNAATWVKSFLFTEENMCTVYTIDALYTLGTPHQKTDVQPNMDIIKYLYNLNSMGDLVANYLAGSGILPGAIDDQPNTANLYVINHSSKTGYPDHSEIHDPVTGTWLLQIPKLFDTFSYDFDGYITFIDKNTPPTYHVANTTHCLRDIPNATGIPSCAGLPREAYLKMPKKMGAQAGG